MDCVAVLAGEVSRCPCWHTWTISAKKKKKKSFSDCLNYKEFLFIDESQQRDYYIFCKVCRWDISILYCKEGNRKPSISAMWKQQQWQQKLGTWNIRRLAAFCAVRQWCMAVMKNFVITLEWLKMFCITATWSIHILCVLDFCYHRCCAVAAFESHFKEAVVYAHPPPPPLPPTLPHPYPPADNAVFLAFLWHFWDIVLKKSFKSFLKSQKWPTLSFKSLFWMNPCWCVFVYLFRWSVRLSGGPWEDEGKRSQIKI